MKLLIIVAFFLTQIALLHASEDDPSLSELRDIANHWLVAIEQQRFEAEKHKDVLGDTLIVKTTILLNNQVTDVEGFLSKIESSSLTQLLDDLLLYRIRCIKVRKFVIDKATREASNYVELAPRSAERVAYYGSDLEPYSALSYEANMIKSICLHQLMKAVFKRIADPKQLNLHIKDKIRVQPSLFAYLQGDAEIPWALDFTLGIRVPGYAPYSDVPDYPLIRDYVEKYGSTEVEAQSDNLKVIMLPMFISHYSTMQKSRKKVTLTRFEAKQFPTNVDFVDVNRFADTFQIEYLLPDPDFLKRRSLPGPQAIVNASEVVSQAESTEQLTVVKSEIESAVASDTKTMKTILPSLMPQVRPRVSKFEKAQDWLRNKLFNHEVKTIKGRDWEKTLEKIDGVTIRRNSGSSHFEVLREGHVIGGYFHADEYVISYKKWLQKIILDLGFNPKITDEN